MFESIYAKLFIGFTAPLAGVMVSLSSHIPELQVISICIGAVVGLIAMANGAIDLCRKVRNKK
jgi:hypothetical protein